MTLQRRGVLAGMGAAAAATSLPATSREAALPPVRRVRANGIDLAVYEAGSGPTIMLLHGFPGLAFSWRHQIPALVAAGYHVVAVDLRGYGLSARPPRVEDYDVAHLTGDLVGLLDALGVEKAVFMGHDWGGLLAWQMPLLHGARVSAVIGVNTPFIPHWMLWLHPDLVRAVRPELGNFVADPRKDPIAQMREVYGPKMYVLFFQDGRSADVVMDRDPRGAIRNSLRKDLVTAETWDDLPREVANMEFYGQPVPAKLPGNDVLTERELDVYVDRFSTTGFTPAINWYRNLSRNWRAGLDVDQTIRVPSLMIMAEHDSVLRPSMADGMETHVPDLERQLVRDCWHFTPEQRPDELNRIVTDWLERRIKAG